MKPARLIGAIAAVIALAIPIASAGAASTGSAPAVDLSSYQAVVSYLTSLGIDPTGVVIQRGAQNYAGPNCPGAGWNCTTATKVVQVGQSGGQNTVECGAGATAIPNSYLTGAVLTSQQVTSLTSTNGPIESLIGGCVTVQQGASTNSAKCVKRSREIAVAMEECLIVQPDGIDDDPNASNQAFALITIDQDGGLLQDATARVKIDQTAMGGAKNFAHVIEYIKQSTKDVGPQVQEGHAFTCVDQATDMGDSFSQVIQSQGSKEQASGVVDQKQNFALRPERCHSTDATSPSSVNTFARITQSSSLTDGGRLESHLNQSHNLDARALGGTQTQGSPTLAAGLEGMVVQNSSGLAKSFGVQNEDQSLFGNSPTVIQHQFGPFRCCSEQTSNSNDDVQIQGMSAQKAVISSDPFSDLVPAVANPEALQESLGIGHFNTSGDGTITHKIDQNEGSDTAYCPQRGQPPPDITTSDATPTCDLVTFGLNGMFFVEFPPPICDDEEFFNPETGKCEGIDIG